MYILCVYLTSRCAILFIKVALHSFLDHFSLYLAAGQGSTIIFNAMVYG